MLTMRDLAFIETQLFEVSNSVSETGGCSLTDCADMATRYAHRLTAEMRQLLMLHEELHRRVVRLSAPADREARLAE